MSGEVACPSPEAAEWSAAPLELYDRCITDAENRIEEQEHRIRESALMGRSAADEAFDLQKMQLLVAILREARERVHGQLPSSL